MVTIIVKDGIAVYGPGVTLTSDYADGGRFRDPTTRLDNADVVVLETLPDDWQPGQWTWDGTTLAMRPEYAAELLTAARELMECSKLQAKLAIAQLGMVADFLALKASLDPVTDFVKIAFVEDAQTWRRTDPTFNAITDALGKTETEKDQFFALARTL